MTKREKPKGVGIEKIRLDELVQFGRQHKHLDDAETWQGVPLVGALLPDWAIRQFVTIDDFVDYEDCPKDVVSYGITSSGYDLRVGGRFKIFTNANCETVTPRNIPEDAWLNKDLTGHAWHEHESTAGQKCSRCGLEWLYGGPMPDGARRMCREALPGVPTTVKIPPNSFALAETVERIEIPRNINCLCLGKSTYARCGIIMNFTPFEPGWRGVVTVEISNSTPLPVEIFAWQGIGQAQFTLTVGSPERAYGEKRNAKYQDQTGLTLPSVK